MTEPTIRKELYLDLAHLEIEFKENSLTLTEYIKAKSEVIRTLEQIEGSEIASKPSTDLKP